MSRSAEAKIEPDILIWAREHAGLTTEEVAKKLPVRPERLQAWEAGSRRPTIKQLRKFGKICRRPLAFFYLPEPPRDFKAINDYRRLPSTEPGMVLGVESPELRYEVRRAYERREIALELFGDEEPDCQFDSLRAALSDNKEDLAERIRTTLAIDFRRQTKWGVRSEVLNQWRSALESSGILVFQAPGIGLDEMRGFSISQMPMPVIVLNNKDSYAARVFTLLHELTHVLLHEDGLCNLRSIDELPAAEKAMEVFCNHVAGAVLVPRRRLLEEDLVRRRRQGAEWPDADIKDLATHYGVSRIVLVRRLLICGRITKAFYEQKQDQYQREYETWRRAPRKGYAPEDEKAISKAGLFFSQLVLTNYYEDRITLSDVSDFLSVQLKHLSKIEAKVMSRSARLKAVS